MSSPVLQATLNIPVTCLSLPQVTMLSTLSYLALLSVVDASVVLVLGGRGDPSVRLDGFGCNTGIPDVPQPYGEEGR